MALISVAVIEKYGGEGIDENLCGFYCTQLASSKFESSLSGFSVEGNDPNTMKRF